MFTYFNDEWNEEQPTESNTYLPRVGKCVKSSVTGEKQKKIPA